MKPKWKDLMNFIQMKIKENPDFLENELYIECLNPELAKKEDYKTIEDSDGWVYVSPVWFQVNGQKEAHVLSTTIESKKITTLNINF